MDTKAAKTRIRIELDGVLAWEVDGVLGETCSFVSTGDYATLLRIQAAIAYAAQQLESEIRVRLALAPGTFTDAFGPQQSADPNVSIDRIEIKDEDSA